VGELADAVELAELAQHARRVYDDEVTDVLPQLVRAGASSGGARPKALIGLRSDSGPGVIFGEGELPDGWDAWLVKFPTSQDDHDVGRREMAWMKMAAEAGLDVPDCRLLPLGSGIGEAFAVRRFDRPGGGRRLHRRSAAGALDVDFSTTVTDYSHLLRLTHFVCDGDQRQLLAMLRLAAFNVATINQDDHLKNVSFLLDADGAWRLAPAYDLTYAPHATGERATLVGGEGRDVRRTHFDAIGRVDEHLEDAGCSGHLAIAASQAVREAAQHLR
jgi:serine/threonine-protein kinase HipA